MSSGPARVDSFDALKRFRAVMVRMAEVIDKGLTEAEVEIQNTLNWLKHDQTAYWNAETRKREQKYRQARLALQTARAQKGALAGRQSFVDERKALAQAERKLAEAREKQAKVKSWIVRLEQEAFDYKGTVQGAQQTVEGDIPRAVATLDRMLDALEEYVRVHVQAEERISAAPTGETSMRRPEAETGDASQREDRKDRADIDESREPGEA